MMRVRKSAMVFLVLALVGVGVLSLASTPDTYAAESRRDPGTALLFSLLLTGGGQIYNGEWGKGLAVIGGQIVLISQWYDTGIECDYYSCYDTIEVNGGMVLASLALQVWSSYDAYTAAKRINEEQGFSVSITPEMQGIEYAMRF